MSIKPELYVTEGKAVPVPAGDVLDLVDGKVDLFITSIVVVMDGYNDFNLIVRDENTDAADISAVDVAEVLQLFGTAVAGIDWRSHVWNATNGYGLIFEPTVPIHYDRLTVQVRNNDGGSPHNISYIVTGYVHEY